MDREYFRLIREIANCVHQANSIAQNSNYSLTYEQAATPYIKDAQKKAQELGRVLSAILDRQVVAIAQLQKR